MEVYRLAQAKYASSLKSSGAPNRWNRSGQQVIYTSGSISLCALELLAHTSGIRPAGTFKVMHIKAELTKAYEISTEMLPENWHLLAAYPVTQQLGSEWYEGEQSFMMRVPSAIIPSEWNYIINTKHPDFKRKVNLIRLEDFFWDHRFPTSGS